MPGRGSPAAIVRSGAAPELRQASVRRAPGCATWAASARPAAERARHAADLKLGWASVRRAPDRATWAASARPAADRAARVERARHAVGLEMGGASVRRAPDRGTPAASVRIARRAGCARGCRAQPVAGHGARLRLEADPSGRPAMPDDPARRGARRMQFGRTLASAESATIVAAGVRTGSRARPSCPEMPARGRAERVDPLGPRAGGGIPAMSVRRVPGGRVRRAPPEPGAGGTRASAGDLLRPRRGVRGRCARRIDRAPPGLRARRV
jgi:hypothetical protein